MKTNLINLINEHEEKVLALNESTFDAIEKANENMKVLDTSFENSVVALIKEASDSEILDVLKDDSIIGKVKVLMMRVVDGSFEKELEKKDGCSNCTSCDCESRSMDIPEYEDETFVFKFDGDDLSLIKNSVVTLSGNMSELKKVVDTTIPTEEEGQFAYISETLEMLLELLKDISKAGDAAGQ